MNKIEVADGPGDLIPDIVKSAWWTVAEWYNRTVEYYRLIPIHLHQHPSHALAVFLTANVIFFIIFVNWLAQILEERVPRELDGDDRKLNQILINGFVVGGSTLIFNTILSKLLSYPLSKSTLIAITATSIAIRLILGHLCAEIPDEGNKTPNGANGAEESNELNQPDVPHEDDVPHENDKSDDCVLIDENDKSDDWVLIDENDESEDFELIEEEGAFTPSEPV